MSDTIDINVNKIVETIEVNATPNVVQININSISVNLANQTEVNDGIVSDKVIAPDTLAGWWTYVKGLAQTFAQKITFSSGALFSPQVAPTYERGRVYFDDANDCISFMDSISGTSVQVGYEVLMRARNNTGATIPNGSVVYISGAIGQNSTVALAQANTLPTSEIIGIATHNIANNTVGKICVFGLINDVDTSSFTDGQMLYLSATVAGGLTSTIPASPNFVVALGVVEHAHPTQGKILVRPQRALSNNNALGTAQNVPPTQNAVKSALDLKQDKLTETNFGQFMDIDLTTKVTPSINDTLLGRDSLTNEAVEIPISSTFQESVNTKLSLLACVIRWNNSLSNWELINDSTHKPIYVTSVQSAENDNFNFDINYPEVDTVGGVSVLPDENYGRQGVFCVGASVGKSVIRCRVYKQGISINFTTLNGTTWSMQTDTTALVLPSQFTSSFNSTNGELTITHSALIFGFSDNVLPLKFPGSNLTPEFVSKTTTSFVIRFRDSSGNIVLNANSDMDFQLIRTGVFRVPNLNLSTYSGGANFWITAIHSKEGVAGGLPFDYPIDNIPVLGSENLITSNAVKVVENSLIAKSVGGTYTTNNILTLTQNEYDSILTKDPTTLYFIV